jgi:hypothetical protein
MKTFALTCLANLLALAAAAQGTVTFQNNSTFPGWSPATDRNVKFSETTALYNPLLTPGANVSSNYAGVNLSGLRAALFYAPGVVADADWYTLTSLASASGSPFATFKNSTSTTAGSWFGGTRSMAGIPAQNGLVSLMVFVWDSAWAAEPLSRAALRGLHGRSAVFQYTTPASAMPAPSDFLPQNLRSFTLDSVLEWGLPPDAWGGVPEPTTTTLFGLGVAILTLRRWRHLHRRADETSGRSENAARIDCIN